MEHLSLIYDSFHNGIVLFYFLYKVSGCHERLHFAAIQLLRKTLEAWKCINTFDIKFELTHVLVYKIFQYLLDFFFKNSH